MDIMDIIALVVLGIPLLLGIIGIIIEKKRTGKNWIGQGYGRK